MKIDTKTCVRVGLGIFLLYLCIHYWAAVSALLGTMLAAASPLLLGCAIAYVVNILMSFYERHYFRDSEHPVLRRSQRPVCLIAALITLLSAIALVVVLVVPQLVACVRLLIAEVPGALKAFIAWLEKWDLLPEDIVAYLSKIDWQSKLTQIISTVTSGISDVVGAVAGVLSSVVGAVITAFLSIIFALYLLLGKDRLGRQARAVLQRYLKPRWYERFMYTVTVLDDCFHRYIVGQCTEAVILGVLCAVGMWVLRLPYAAMIGALTAFTALIPIAGAYIGGIMGAFMIFTVSPIKAVIFVLFLVILQQVEGNIIYPRVVGSSMGLPGIWVLAAVTIGGGIMGIGGMLLGVPVAAAAYRLLRDDVYRERPGGGTPSPAEEAETATDTAEAETPRV